MQAARLMVLLVFCPGEGETPKAEVEAPAPAAEPAPEEKPEE